MTKWQNFIKGIIAENPVLVGLLGMCPTLAVTNSVEKAIGMGVSVIFVLVMSNLIVSLIRNITPSNIRIPVYIVVIASLVTILEMLMHAYVKSLYDQLGIFLPLIVVNCIILGRAEAFASKNKPVDSMIDGLGMGIGFSFAIIILAALREFFGKGTLTIWGSFKIDVVSAVNQLFGSDYITTHIFVPANMFVLPAGAFLMLGFLIAFSNYLQDKKAQSDAKKAEVK